MPLLLFKQPETRPVIRRNCVDDCLPVLRQFIMAQEETVTGTDGIDQLWDFPHITDDMVSTDDKLGVSHS